MANYSSQSHKIQDLIKQVHDLDDDELYDLYGIEVYEDGSVYDDVFDKMFNTAADWARFSVETEEIEEAEIGYPSPELSD